MYVIIMMTISFIGALVFVMASYLGFFQPVELTQTTTTPLQVIYKEHLGPYHLSVESLLEIEKWAKDNKVPCPQTFGQYFDDPNQVDSDRLRSHVGCVTTQVDGLNSPYSTKIIAAQPILKAKFGGSPSLGPIKVYPEAQEWMRENGFQIVGPVTEIHQLHSNESMTTTYHFPIKPVSESK